MGLSKGKGWKCEGGREASEPSIRQSAPLGHRWMGRAEFMQVERFAARTPTRGGTIP